MRLFGCWCCYHHDTMSQFGGEAKGRRARGFYGTFKVHCFGKGNKGVDTFFRCEQYDPNFGFGMITGAGFGMVTGAGFEGYNRGKKRGEAASLSREEGADGKKSG